MTDNQEITLNQLLAELKQRGINKLIIEKESSKFIDALFEQDFDIKSFCGIEIVKKYGKL